MNRSIIAMATSLLLALTACKPDPATLSQIEGTITLQGAPPTPLNIDTSMDPTCNPTGAPAPHAEQFVVHDGKLANVYLYIKANPSLDVTTRPQAPVIIDQKGCIYIPHVVAIPQGGAVDFHNDDAGMHNIETMPTAIGNNRLDTSQAPHGAPRTTQFPNAEAMIPVRCNMHPWMNAFINVSPTPFYTISDPQGHFRIPNLPPGDYTLAAVHEILGEQTLHLTIKPKSTATADFTFNMDHQPPAK